MDHPTYEIDSEPTLLILKDDCLIKIFRLLEWGDFINVHNTCRRLRNVCTAISALQCKTIIVYNMGLDGECYTAISKQEFVHNLSVIETHVLTVEITNPNRFIIETISDRCKNVTSLSLFGHEYPFQLNGFRNLKKLELATDAGKLPMNIEILKSCFENNQGLEFVDIECWLNVDSLMGVMETLTLLPKLKTLVLPHYDFFNVNDNIQHLLRLNCLTKLTFYSSENCIQLLIQLSKNLNLKELIIYTNWDNDTYRILKSFLNVEFLSLFRLGDMSEISGILDATEFPPKLKQLTICEIRLSCATFLSIVKQLKFLKEFTIINGDIFSDRNKCKTFIKIAL